MMSSHNSIITSNDTSTSTSVSMPSPSPASSRKRKKCDDKEKQCNSERQEAISQAIAKLIACNMLPISFVSSDAFKEFMTVLEPGYKVPCEQTIKTRLQFFYNDVRKKIENLLSLASSVSLTIDEWSSRAQDSYVSIEAQLFDKEGELRHVTLCNEEMKDNPTAQNIADTVVVAMGEWELEGKVQAVVHDSAAVMVAAGNLLDDIPDNINCAAHLFQLAVKDSISAVPLYGEILAKSRAITKHFRKSNVASKELAVRQKQLNIPTQKLVSHCPTRWNTDFYMSESLLQNRGAISLVLSDRKVTKPSVAQHLEFVESDWSTMEEMVKLLKPFQLATTVLCSESQPTLSMIRPILKGILDKHMTVSLNDSRNICLFKEAIRCSLLRRFDTHGVAASQVAQFFDPRYKSLASEDERSKITIHNYIKRMLEGNEPASQEETSMLNEIALDFLFQAEIERKDWSSQFHLYMAEPQISHNLDPLMWWKNHKDKYPNLYQFALKYLSIPATSAISERTFSTAGNIVTSKRSCLLPENVNLLTCLYQNRSLM